MSADGTKVTKVTRFLSANEVDQLARQFDERYQVFILTAAYLGPRWSQLAGLRATDLALPNGRLNITHTLVELDGHFIEGPPKTKKGPQELRSTPVQASSERRRPTPPQDP